MAEKRIISAKASPIMGKVATILNERELAINIGSKDGVTEGMKFKVLADQPADILDPDTGANLGSVEREKVRVMATEVNEKFTVCRTYRKEYIPGGPLHGTFSSLLKSYGLTDPPREIIETLRADDKSLPPPLSEEESYVKKGDRVILVVEEDNS
ncbi:MAG: hypothetical protein HS126_19305 [Anaerolineales bacterium]|nr:hypothetical protein [Anaerolineales bacterium]